MLSSTPVTRPRDIVVVGGSVEALSDLVRITIALPKDYLSVVLVALQRPPGKQPRAESIAQFRSPLPADYAVDGEALERGRVYIAPPNKLMSVSAKDTISLQDDATGKMAGEAVDRLFISAAAVYGNRVVGVVLSGVGTDGTEGLKAIHAAGGLGIVQSPADASHREMPVSAILGDHPDMIAILDDIPKAILQLTK
ncbi:MAG: hypothetical protein KKC79_11020 [Gammaproteobacteria bacterium]|nr:hypothetical protein [Gammaproteobacteria bacterium]MBU1441610.1 hypothetical protein [Gammaproteobacteria bacterium]MBU2288374.1 hypothetical protein [Gammaproteobacteria bacterium]MBU2409160.1 hypothetical protein [Gammaproteobacteria bacterium]